MKKSIFTYILLLATLLTSTPVQADTSIPVLQSEGAVLMDADTGQVLYSKAPDKGFPPASITKFMTALLTVENLEPVEEITFSYNAVMSIERGSSHIGMREGETINVEDAMHGLLLQSANEVANGLAEAIGGSIEGFATMMNQRAVELGATNTNFLNPHGLYDEDQYTSAMDMALITRELLKHDFFLEVMSHHKWQIAPTNTVDEIRYLHQNHKLLNPVKDPKLYREDVIAGKTGYTIQSGHTLVTVAEQDGRRLIAVSLRTDARHLYSDTTTMLDYGFDAFLPLTVGAEDIEVISHIRSDSGDQGTATAKPSMPLRILVPSGAHRSDIDSSKTYQTVLDEDAYVGQVIGTVTYAIGDMTLGTVDLVISELHLKEPAAITLTKEAELPPTPAPVEDKSPIGYFLWLIPITLLPVISYALYRYDCSRRMTYRQYKAMREYNKTDI